MEDEILPTLESHFGNLTDPRIDRTKLHKLLDILVIAICAVIAGADNWVMSKSSAKPGSAGSRRFWRCPTASLRMTPSPGCLPAWTRSSSRPVFCAG